jgi:hypothetical protein
MQIVDFIFGKAEGTLFVLVPTEGCFGIRVQWRFRQSEPKRTSMPRLKKQKVPPGTLHCAWRHAFKLSSLKELP